MEVMGERAEEQTDRTSDPTAALTSLKRELVGGLGRKDPGLAARL